MRAIECLVRKFFNSPKYLCGLGMPSGTVPWGKVVCQECISQTLLSVLGQKRSLGLLFGKIDQRILREALKVVDLMVLNRQAT
jgi:hypothetical protein